MSHMTNYTHTPNNPYGDSRTAGAGRFAASPSGAQQASSYPEPSYTAVMPAGFDAEGDHGAFPGAIPARPVSAGGAEYGGRGGKGPKGGKPGKGRGLGKKIAIAVLAVLFVALIGGGIWFWQYVQNVTNKIHEGVDESLSAALSEETKPGEPFYMLLMGVDRSEERAGTAEYGDDFRSDSMILARIDPQQKTVTLISIQRDTYVDIEGYGYNKINAAHAYGGAALTVETVSKFAGVPISHYAEIDFDGFEAVVDALGGIEVNVPVEIDDADAGGYVPAGEQTLTGEQALILCRSRHTYDEIGPGDFYRAANQRMVIGAIASKVLASDPVTMANTITSMADYITTDMSLDEILSVATTMRGIDTENDIYSAMNPTVSSYDGTLWIEYADVTAWRTMMVRVDQGLPPYEDEELNKNDGGTVDGTVWQGESS